MIRPVVLEQEKRRRENATTYEGFSSGSVLKSLRSPAFDRGSNISWIGPFVSGRQSRSFVGNQYKGAIFGGNERLSAVQALGEQVLASVIESPQTIQKYTGSGCPSKKTAQPPRVGAEATLHVTLSLIETLRASRRIAGRRYWFPPIRIAQNLK